MVVGGQDWRIKTTVARRIKRERVKKTRAVCRGLKSRNRQRESVANHKTLAASVVVKQYV